MHILLSPGRSLVVLIEVVRIDGGLAFDLLAATSILVRLGIGFLVRSGHWKEMQMVGKTREV